MGLRRNQDPSVKAGAAACLCVARRQGVKPLQPVDGRNAGLGFVEGENLPVHGAPGRAFILRIDDCGLRIEKAGRHVRLCGHVGERVGGPDGEDVLLWNLQNRDSGGCLEEAAADHGVLHRRDAPAEVLVVPGSALQGAVDEEPQQLRVDFGLWRIEIDGVGLGLRQELPDVLAGGLALFGVVENEGNVFGPLWRPRLLGSRLGLGLERLEVQGGVRFEEERRRFTVGCEKLHSVRRSTRDKSG